MRTPEFITISFTMTAYFMEASQMSKTPGFIDSQLTGDSSGHQFNISPSLCVRLSSHFFFSMDVCRHAGQKFTVLDENCCFNSTQF
jgi:hypothetical protein